jgi:tRNA-splicing ligase RtcB
MSLKVLNGKFSRIHLWADLSQVESAALDQLKNIAALPWVRRISVMPDVHLGKGATVGSVIAMKDALAPAAVGVDIGCGMGAIRTNLKASDLPSNLGPLRFDIEAAIPVGFASHIEPAFGHPHSALGRQATRLFMDFRVLHKDVQELEGRAMKQCGTLGGGNHFIELCLDEGELLCDCPDAICGGREAHIMDNVRSEPRVWLMLHSGSRNIGKSVAEVHINIAKKLDHNQLISDRDLSVFLAGTPEMMAYSHDLEWAQQYAFLNRQVMFELYKSVMLSHFPQVAFDEPILCHHNYVSVERHFGDELIVTRKGAIYAGKGAMGVIPGSMGTKSYIVEGLGNEESMRSASHGAGRRMSRGQAKKNFTLDDLAKQTEGVECRKDAEVLDEIPGAYKDIDVVMEHQKDLVEIKHTLKAVLCVKG